MQQKMIVIFICERKLRKTISSLFVQKEINERMMIKMRLRVFKSFEMFDNIRRNFPPLNFMLNSMLKAFQIEIFTASVNDADNLNFKTHPLSSRLSFCLRYNSVVN